MNKPPNKKTLSILIVEDNIGDARLIEELLKEIDIGDHEVTYVVDTEEVRQISKIKFDVVLLDLHLSDMTPMQTYKIVNNFFPRIPIIVLTGLEDDTLAAKIVRMGAQDYLIKGTFDSGTLRRSIKYSIERKKSQLRLARVESKTRQLQVHANDLEGETKRLEAINKAKDVFLSIASHQLRTPATSVKQYLGMLLEGYGGKVPATQKQFIETAYQSNERQIKIVDDLLRVAKLDAGHITLHKRLIDLNQMIMRVIADQEQAFKIRKQIVLFKPFEGLEPVNVDTNNLQMVFENLLDNAGKYSDENTTVEISVRQTRDKIIIEFRDEGIGISNTDQVKLFQKFSRIDNSFKYSPNGSGLGLYWAQEIVKLHDGMIRVKSSPGNGTTFSIELPHKSANVKNNKLLPSSIAANKNLVVPAVSLAD